MTYGLSGELLTLNNETRTYNSRLQLTKITVPSVGMNMEYRYSSNQNNGQITQQKDWISGEEMTYIYASLQRLIGAVTTDSSWGQSFTYDGFGNRTSEAVTKGSAPYGNWSYDPATNRVIGQSYDANGNLGVGSYDVENRLVSVAAAYNPNNQYQNELYAYAPDNKRIWKRKADGTEELYFYGISGQHLGTYNSAVTYGNGYFAAAVNTSLYFGSRAIISKGAYFTPDRVGSNRGGGSRFFPYGEEQQVTAQDRDKFATYYRDSTTGLDYAQNRYYASTLSRFTSPDPDWQSAKLTNPASWNRYSYVIDDPVNRNDPTGLDDSECNDLLSKINKIVFGDTSTLQGSKGLIQRFREQIYGAMAPGTSGWDNHNTQIQGRQKNLKRIMTNFIDDKCPPPSNWKVFDEWANKKTPTKNDYKGPQNAPNLMQYLYEVVGSYIFYQLAPTLEQMFEDLAPQIEQLAPMLGTVFSVDSNITFGDMVGGGSNGSNSGAGEQHDDEL